MLESQAELFTRVRKQTETLCEGLNAEDMMVQSMPDASPTKWHLAHTTWFFETFILQQFVSGYRPFNPHFCQLFNSYYQSVGKQHPRPQRGFLSRPTLSEVRDYRARVDDAMLNLLSENNPQVNVLTHTGLHHEMQHQELMATDILHALAQNPLLPAPKPHTPAPATKALTLEFVAFEAQSAEVGAEDSGFSYDCERPKHRTWLTEFSLANRLISNGEWLAFMQDGGYENPLLWLSDGWACAQNNRWQAPLYWQKRDDQWHQFGLDGLHPVEPDAPVCHISFYEADAFARWAGKRLPREHELEMISLHENIQGNFVEQHHWRPRAATAVGQSGVAQIYGDVWEWTQSAYLPYPNFKPEQGGLGEYNGKFMINQLVLKGGSCVTPTGQMRPSYRNFFYPHQRWQFSGARLASDKI